LVIAHWHVISTRDINVDRGRCYPPTSILLSHPFLGHRTWNFIYTNVLRYVWCGRIPAAGHAASSEFVCLQCTLQIAVHYLVLVAVGRGLFRLPIQELHLASNANVGGPTTAAAMAQAKQWKRLVLPALLVGILGYAIATGIALALGPILLRLPTL
jgi:hypothetical protein